MHATLLGQSIQTRFEPSKQSLPIDCIVDGKTIVSIFDPLNALTPIEETVEGIVKSVIDVP